MLGLIRHPEDTARQVIRFGPLERHGMKAMLFRQVAADMRLPFEEISPTDGAQELGRDG